MVTVQALMSFAFSVSGPFLPLYVISLGVKPIAAVSVWAGVIASVNFLAAAIFSPIWGGVADRSGRKVMVIRSCVAVAIFTAAMGAVQNVWQLFAARACMGIFSGFSAAAIAMVGTQVPEESLGYSLGWMTTGQLVGALCGPLFGGFLADRLHDYRAVFYGTSLVAFLAALVCLVFVHERFKPVARAPRGSLLANLREVATHPRLAPMFVVILLAQVVAFGAQPVVPLFVRTLVDNAAWLATAAGLAFAVTGFADLIASPFLGKRSDRIGYRRVLLLSLGGVAAFTIPQAMVRAIWPFIALRFGVGLFLGGVLPTANALIGRIFPRERRGQVYGVTSSATFLGMFLGPLLGGLIAARFGFEAVFLAIGALTLANLAWVAVMVRTPLPNG
jgi:MFS transporter, DHA1 family, multidrug resistance protein